MSVVSPVISEFPKGRKCAVANSSLFSSPQLPNCLFFPISLSILSWFQHLLSLFRLVISDFSSWRGGNSSRDIFPVPSCSPHPIPVYLWGWALLLAVVVTYLNILHITNYVSWPVAKLTNSCLLEAPEKKKKIHIFRMWLKSSLLATWWHFPEVGLF